MLSFLVSRRTRELGIRVALGAQPRDVRWLVIREGATLCAVGLAVGVAGALAAMRWLASELHGVSPIDPLTYVAVVVTIALVTLWRLLRADAAGDARRSARSSCAISDAPTWNMDELARRSSRPG